MSEKPPPEAVDLVDNMLSPELFCDGAFSFFVAAGVVRMVLTSVRCPQNLASPGRPVPVVVARIAMPVAAAQGLALDLNSFLENQGFSPTAAATAGATKQ
jgi:hypothetical protein